MDGHDVVTLFLKRISDLRETHITSTIGGACKDFPAYQKQVGIIEGLNLAERELQEILQTNKEFDDDDN